jgi:hypothetical protein
VKARRALTSLLGAAVVAALGWSAVRDVPHSWRLLRGQYEQYHGYSRVERDQAFIDKIPAPANIFDYWRSWLRSGDRYWIQIPYEAFSATGDKKYIVRTVSHLYLLPATEATSLRDANVVLSWDADPTALGLRYSEQHRLGLQLIFVSRIDSGG